MIFTWSLKLIGYSFKKVYLFVRPEPNLLYLFTFNPSYSFTYLSRWNQVQINILRISLGQGVTKANLHRCSWHGGGGIKCYLITWIKYWNLFRSKMVELLFPPLSCSFWVPALPLGDNWLNLVYHENDPMTVIVCTYYSQVEHL